MNKEEYNEEPVFYCSRCHSLNIKMIDDTDYCDECGSTDVSSGSIDEWIKNK